MAEAAGFIFGFFSVAHMLDAFVVLLLPHLLDTPLRQIGGWGCGLLPGLDRFSFVLYFGVIRNWVNAKGYRWYFPMLVMAFFSLLDVYRPDLIPPSHSWTPNVLQPALLSSRWFS